MPADPKVKALRGRVLELAGAIADPERGCATFQEYLRWAGQLYQRYSWGNLSLILSARPDSQMVAGYRAWQRVGRQVRHGERGIPILVPIRGQRAEEVDPLTDEPILSRPVGWIVKHVWDVAQTSGGPIPNWRVDLGEESEVLLDATISLAQERGIDVRAEHMYGSVNGLSKGGTIVLNSSRPVGIQASAAIHELAHEGLHPLVVRNESTRSVHEMEAEAVTAVILRHYGYECAVDAAASYCRSHGADSRQLLASMERVTSMAHSLIGGIRRHLPAEYRPPLLPGLGRSITE